MSYKAKVGPQAKKELSRLDRTLARRIRDRLRGTGCQRLVGQGEVIEFTLWKASFSLSPLVEDV